MAWSGRGNSCVLPCSNPKNYLKELVKLMSYRVSRHCYAKLGDEMRLLFSLVAVVTLGQAAIAQGQECKGIKDPSMRLACYDKAAPPVAATLAPRPAMRTTSEVDAQKYVDPIAAEDALLNARTNGICRGC
jgi:hypothetical protein